MKNLGKVTAISLVTSLYVLGIVSAQSSIAGPGGREPGPKRESYPTPEPRRDRPAPRPTPAPRPPCADLGNEWTLTCLAQQPFRLCGPLITSSGNVLNQNYCTDINLETLTNPTGLYSRQPQGLVSACAKIRDATGRWVTRDLPQSNRRFVVCYNPFPQNE